MVSKMVSFPVLVLVLSHLRFMLVQHHISYGPLWYSESDA